MFTAPSLPIQNTIMTDFKYLITIQPLGLLYGSAGKFLSPENLVGRSGTRFPPSAATLSGLFAAAYAENQQLPTLTQQLRLAGPFWAKEDTPQNFYIPTPMNCLVEDKRIQHVLQWSSDQGWHPQNITGKFQKGTWLSIDDYWTHFAIANATSPSPPNPGVIAIPDVPWKQTPHLHPRLSTDQRRVDIDNDQGSLFLENAVALDPDHCLVYLSSLELKDGWYRFGGEGHMVDLTCLELSETNRQRFQTPVGHCFTLITPAVWGSNRLSRRLPDAWPDDVVIFTARPNPFRYRLGHQKNKAGQDIHRTHQPKLLSRGRYAMPAGSIYILKQSLGPWQCDTDWPEAWFPKEGPSLKRWGCGLALTDDKYHLINIHQ